MRAQSILFGNGLNLLNAGTPSWDDLLKILWIRIFQTP